MKRWILTAVLAIGTSAALAATLVPKSTIRGVSAEQMTKLLNELRAESIGELAELKERVRQANEAKKALRGARKGTRTAETEAFRKIVAANAGRPFELEKRRADLEKIAALEESSVAKVDPGLTIAPRKPSITSISPALAASLANAVKNLKKKVFKAPFPVELEWDRLEPPGANASLAVSTSSSGSFSTSVVMQGSASAATEADPGVQFTIPAGHPGFRVTATIDLESTSVFGNPGPNGSLYVVTGFELRVMSLDVAVDGDEGMVLADVVADDSNQTASESVGAKTVTIYGSEIPATPGATYFAFAGGWLNAGGGGDAIAWVNGKVKEITVHYLD